MEKPETLDSAFPVVSSLMLFTLLLFLASLLLFLSVVVTSFDNLFPLAAPRGDLLFEVCALISSASPPSLRFSADLMSGYK